jgi:hypothetical protein
MPPALMKAARAEVVQGKVVTRATFLVARAPAIRAAMVPGRCCR